MPQPPAWKTPASWHGRPAMHSESHELETNVWQERQLLQVRRTFYIGLPTRLKSPKPCLDISGHCFSVRSRLTVLATPQIGSSQVEKELSMLHSNVGFRSARHAEKKTEGNNQDKLKPCLRFALLALCSRFREGSSSCIQFLFDCFFCFCQTGLED